MSETPLRCELCRNYCDSEDLFCSNCGRELPVSEPGQGTGNKPVNAKRPAGAIEEGFIGFDCETCGASLTYDAEKEGLRCSFCGSVTLRRQENATGRIRAECFLPFAVSRDAAEREFEEWIARGFFRPFGIRSEARVVSMQPVYVPFWKFRARTHTYWSGDSSKTPAIRSVVAACRTLTCPRSARTCAGLRGAVRCRSVSEGPTACSQSRSSPAGARSSALFPLSRSESRRGRSGSNSHFRGANRSASGSGSCPTAA